MDQLKPNAEKTVEYSKSDESSETIASLTIEKQTFEGRGPNKIQAKTNAYKKAVKFYDKGKGIVFF